MHRGFCRCNGVRMEASGTTDFQGYCHCDDCRRSSGAPVLAFAGYEKTKIKWTADATLTRWQNGPFARLFCEACGSPVAYTDEQADDMIFFYVGFMENAEAFAPEHHSYNGERLEWLTLADSLPQFDDTSYPRPE